MSLLVLTSLASLLVCGGAATLPTFELPRLGWLALTTVVSLILAVAFARTFSAWPTGLAAAGMSLLLQRLDDYLMVRADAALETIKALQRRS